MLIRPIKKEDYLDVLELENTYWTAQTSPFYENKLSEIDLVKEQNNRSGRLVAVIHDKIVGTLSYNPYYPFDQGKHVVTFGLLVDPNYRRQGIGGALLQFFTSVAISKGYTKIAIHITSGNNSAIKCYEKNGFKQEGQLSGHFKIDGSSHDDLIYGKHLEDNSYAR
ncbi:N-acetyltransferase family protein [Streptococcus fryi]